MSDTQKPKKPGRIQRNERTLKGKEIWAAVDAGAARAPQKVRDRISALSQHNEEIRVNGKTLAEALCETIESFDLGETPGVLPVLEGASFGTVDERTVVLFPDDGRLDDLDDFFRRLNPNTTFSIVPTEGYRVIREEDHHRQVREAVEEMAGKFKHAMRAHNGGFDHVMICPEDGHSYFDEFVYCLIARLTNTEDQP